MPPEEVVLYECSILRGFGSEEERMDNRFAISDEEYQVILQEMTGGEFARYDTLLAAAQRLIEPYCKSRCGATTDAWEEIRQEALFRIFRGCENSFFYGNLQEEKGAVALTRWIYRVTANCLKDYWASAKRQSEGRLALLSAILQQNGIPGGFRRGRPAIGGLACDGRRAKGARPLCRRYRSGGWTRRSERPRCRRL